MPSPLSLTYPITNTRPLWTCTRMIIVPADKGRATVVLSKEKYIQKMRQITDDDSKYHILQKDPTVKTENKISDALKRLKQKGYIDDKLHDRLTPHYSNPPQL